MDKILRAEIVAEVKRSMAELNEVYQEEWLTKEQLCEQFPMFTLSWIKTFGEKSSIPRERISVQSEDGSGVRSRFMYPKHKINRLIAEGYFRNIAID